MDMIKNLDVAKSLIANGVLDYAAFLAVIDKLTGGELGPVAPKASLDAIRDLIDRHPLIPPIEVREAFGLSDLAAARDLIQPLLDAEEIILKDVHHSWFIQRI